MQIQFNYIRSGERLLLQIREEEFVDDACARDANRALLLRSLMGCHHHAAKDTFGAYRHLWAIVEAAHRLTFRALLELIWWKVQACLDERVIEHAVLFAARHKAEASQIGEHGPGAILAIEPQQSKSLWKLVRREVACDRRDPLAQLRSVASVAPVAT